MMSAVPSTSTFQHTSTTPPLPSALVHASTHLTWQPIDWCTWHHPPGRSGHMRINWPTFFVLLTWAYLLPRPHTSPCQSHHPVLLTASIQPWQA
jgi:hypothetical protein